MKVSIKLTKIFIRLTVILLFGSLISYCNPKEKPKKSDLEKNDLKGDVILVIENEEIGPWTFYNSNGYIEQEYKNDPFPTVKKFTYANNKLQKTSDKSKSPNVYNVETIYNYNKIGILQSEVKIDRTGNKKNIKTEFTYNDKGELIKLKDNTGFIITYNYNSDGKVESEILKFNDQSTNFSVENKNYYDENGVLVYLETYYPNTKEKKKRIFNYKLDSKGNWIEKSITENGNEISIVKRVIFYKGDNISSYLKKVSKA